MVGPSVFLAWRKGFPVDVSLLSEEWAERDHLSQEHTRGS